MNLLYLVLNSSALEEVYPKKDLTTAGFIDVLYPPVSFTEWISSEFHERGAAFRELFQAASTASLESNATRKETEGLNLKSGPALMA